MFSVNTLKTLNLNNQFLFFSEGLLEKLSDDEFGKTSKGYLIYGLYSKNNDFLNFIFLVGITVNNWLFVFFTSCNLFSYSMVSLYMYTIV